MTSLLRSWNGHLAFQLLDWLISILQKQIHLLFTFLPLSVLPGPPCFCQQLAAAAGSLIHPSLGTSPHPVVFLLWGFHVCLCLCFSTTMSWIGPHLPCAPHLQNEEFRPANCQRPSQLWHCDPLDMETKLNICYIHKTIILSPDPQEICPDWITDVLETNSFHNIF